MTKADRTAGVIPTIDQGTRCLVARTHAELEQDELAELTGLSRKTISNYERGRVKPRRAGLIAIAFATGVDLEWLETGKTPTRIARSGVVKCAIRDSNPEPAG